MGKWLFFAGTIMQTNHQLLGTQKRTVHSKAALKIPHPRDDSLSQG